MIEMSRSMPKTGTGVGGLGRVVCRRKCLAWF